MSHRRAFYAIGSEAGDAMIASLTSLIRDSRLREEMEAQTIDKMLHITTPTVATLTSNYKRKIAISRRLPILRVCHI